MRECSLEKVFILELDGHGLLLLAGVLKFEYGFANVF